METQPTPIQKRIEQAVTNGIGYSSVLNNSKDMSSLLDSEEGVQLKLGCMDIECKTLPEEGIRNFGKVIRVVFGKALYDMNSDSQVLHKLNRVSEKLLEYVYPELTQPKSPEEDFGTYYLKNI